MRLVPSAILIIWLVAGWITLRGTRRLARLSTTPPDGVRPAVSVIVPARNEARALPRSIASLVGQTYPDLEIIALNDRSTDDTGAVLESLMHIHSRLTVIHLDSLPEGWVGKTHALYIGAGEAQGEWLLFTDADVIFHPQCLEAAVAWAEANRVDHLVVIPGVETVGFWENILVSCFSLLFALTQRPWRVSDPRSRASIGIGAFNLIRRSAYEAIGTHRAVANAVVDDLELGRLAKRHGLRQAVVGGEHLLCVRWQVGLSGMVSGLEKNAFAGMEYSLARAVAACLALVILGIVPFLGAALFSARTLWAASALAVIGIQAALARQARQPTWPALFHPLAVAVLIYAIARSTVLTLRRGSVQWRGTQYPLAMLRRPPGPPTT
jgi:hypothetical protein